MKRIQLSKYVKNMLVRNTFSSKLKSANNHDVVDAFLHGLRLDHLKFSSYVFIPKNGINQTALKSRGFVTVLDKINCDIVKLGDDVVYNEEYNLLMILIDVSKWDTLLTSMEIAVKSSNDFTKQSKILLSSNIVLNSKKDNNEPAMS